MRILVTGAAGFVGTAVCRTLSEAGHHVTAVTRTPPSAPLAAARSLALGDLGAGTDWSAALTDIEAVVHLAGRAHVLNEDAARSEALYREANVAALAALAEQAASRGVKRFVFASSIKVNGEATHGTPMRWDRPPAPEDAYGRSKLAAEQRLRELAGDRMEWVILRPPLMYGPGVRGNMARLFAIAERGWPVPFGSIRNVRDLLYVGSFAELIASAVANPAAAGRILLARDGEPVSTAELFRKVAAALGRRPVVLPCPVVLLEAAGRLAGRAAEIRRLTGDLEIDDSDTRLTLDWAPRTRMDEAMRLTAAWFRQGHPKQ